jgi:hypothetical protein
MKLIGRQLELPEQFLSFFALKGSKKKSFFMVPPEDKLYAAVTKIAYAIKEYNRLVHIT